MFLYFRTEIETARCYVSPAAALPKASVAERPLALPPVTRKRGMELWLITIRICHLIWMLTIRNLGTECSSGHSKRNANYKSLSRSLKKRSPLQRRLLPTRIVCCTYKSQVSKCGEWLNQRSNSGSLAIFTTMRRASSLVSIFAADLRPGSLRNRHTRDLDREHRGQQKPRQWPQRSKVEGSGWVLR